MQNKLSRELMQKQYWRHFLLVSNLTVQRELSCRPSQSETFGCSQKAAKQTPDLPHFSLSHPLPPHSKAGISCWWPSANAHSLTENLLWRWAHETEEGENYWIEMHVMKVPSGKIWKVYTAGTLFYSHARETDYHHIYTQTPVENTQVKLKGTEVVDWAIKRSWW